MTTAYAIKVDGSIDARSVHPRKQGAMVNWLLTDCQVMLTASVDDAAIERLFAEQAKGKPVDCVRVGISEMH